MQPAWQVALRFLVIVIMSLWQPTLSSTCNTRYEDVASLTVSSKVIVDAVALDKGAVSVFEKTDGVLFSINSFLKGNVSRTRNESLIAVASDSDCLAGVKLQQRYILFLTGSKLDVDFLVAKRIFMPKGKPVLYDENTRSQVAMFSCPTCGKKPKAKLKLPTSIIRSEVRLEMNCAVTGSPLPMVTWFRGNIQLDSNEEVTITGSNTASSTLTIVADRVYDYVDSYFCRASNVLGSADSDKAYLTADPGDPKASEVSYFKECEDQSYCSDRGICEEIIETGYKRCNCSLGYEGKRCQISLVTEYPLKTSQFSILSYISLVLFFLVLMALIMILVILLKFKSEYNIDKMKMLNQLNILRDMEAHSDSSKDKSYYETKPSKLQNLSSNSDKESLLVCTNNRRDKASAQELTPFDNESRSLFHSPTVAHNKPEQRANLRPENTVISSLPPQQKFTFNETKPPLVRHNADLRLPIGRDANDIRRHGPIAASHAELGRPDSNIRTNQREPTKWVDSIDQSVASRETRLKEEADAIVNEMINYSINGNNNRTNTLRAAK